MNDAKSEIVTLKDIISEQRGIIEGMKNAPEKSTIKIDISQKGKSLTVLIENDFHEHKLPVVSDIVANINNPEWELKRVVGLKFVMQTLKLLKASIQVSVLENKNRVRWYVEIPEP